MSPGRARHAQADEAGPADGPGGAVGGPRAAAPGPALRPDAHAARARLAGGPASLQVLEQLEREPWATAVVREQDRVTVRLDDRWIEQTGSALAGRRRRGSRARRSRALGALRRAVLGPQRHEGAARRAHAQPRDRQRARGVAGPGRRRGRAAQPDLRRRAQHGRGDGRRRQERPPRPVLAGGRPRRATTSSASATPATWPAATASYAGEIEEPGDSLSRELQCATTRPTSCSGA